MPEKPTAACLVGNNVWLGDCIGQIHAYLWVSSFHDYLYVRPA
jgi:hypothetical protein